MSNARELAELGGAYSTGGYPHFKNRIINGAMMIDQRNAGASVTVNNVNTYWPVDRFLANASASAGVFTAQRSTTAPAGFSNSVLATVTTASTPSAGHQYALDQKIEGFNIIDFGFGTAAASTVTLSFWVRSSLTGTFAGGLSNSAGDRSYVFTYSISSANTWEQKTITIAGDTSGTWLTTNGIGMRVIFDLGAGSSFQAASGSWVNSYSYATSGSVKTISTSGATFYITGVQLEKGSTATSFDYRPYGTELALCQRYYHQINGNGGYSFMGCSGHTNSTNARVGLAFPVTMRTQSTLTTSAVGTFTVSNSTGNNSVSGITLGTTNLYGAWITFTTSSSNAGAAGLLLDNNSSAAYLGFSAEL